METGAVRGLDGTTFADVAATGDLIVFVTIATGDVTATGDTAGAVVRVMVLAKLCPISNETLAGTGDVFTGSGLACILILLASSIAFTFSGGNFFNVSSKSLGFDAVDTAVAACACEPGV